MFLVRVVDGVPTVTMIDCLKSAFIEGVLYLLVPLTAAIDSAAPDDLTPTPSILSAAVTRPPLRATKPSRTKHEQVVDDVVRVLAVQAGPAPPKQILQCLEANDIDWFDKAHRPLAKRLVRLGGHLWQEAKCKGTARLICPRHGFYWLSDAELARQRFAHGRGSQ